VLAARLDVSRASLRAALAALVAAGLLEPAAGRTGPKVRSSLVPPEMWPETGLPERDELFALLEARRAIEPVLARLAAARATAAALEELDDTILAPRATQRR